jgi:hypothetical protein
MSGFSNFNAEEISNNFEGNAFNSIENKNDSSIKTEVENKTDKTETKDDNAFSTTILEKEDTEIKGDSFTSKDNKMENDKIEIETKKEIVDNAFSTTILEKEDTEIKGDSFTSKDNKNENDKIEIETKKEIVEDQNAISNKIIEKENTDIKSDLFTQKKRQNEDEEGSDFDTISTNHHDFVNDKVAFCLKVKKAFYIKNGKEHPVSIPYLNFENDGHITLDGKDDIGNFSFSGKIEDDLIYLKKKYHGKHTDFYIGHIIKNQIKMVYDLSEEFSHKRSELKNKRYNAGIEFDSTVFNYDNADGNHNFYLNKDSKDGHFKGFAIIDKKCWKVIMTVRPDGYGSIKMKNGNDFNKLDVLVKDNNIYETY